MEDEEIIGGIPDGGIPVPVESEPVKISRRLEKTHYMIFYTMNGCTEWCNNILCDSEAECVESISNLAGIEKMRVVRISLPVMTPEGAVFV